MAHKHTNLSITVKNWPHCASNRAAQPTSITNRVFLLAIVATPIDCMFYLICSSHLLMCTSGLLFAGKNRQQHKSLKLHDAADRQGAHGVCALRALVISALTLIMRSTLGPGQTNWKITKTLLEVDTILDVSV